MTRSTSSATLAILANCSTSLSVSFGLLSTAAATSRLGSRTSTERCSRVPRVASFMRSMMLSVDSALGSAVSASPSARPSGDPSASAVSIKGASASATTPPGVKPRAVKYCRISPGTSARPMKASTAGRGSRSMVCAAAPATSGSLSSFRMSSSASWSSARGANAPCAASSRTSRATSPRRKKSTSGVRRPGSMQARCKTLSASRAARRGWRCRCEV